MHPRLRRAAPALAVAALAITVAGAFAAARVPASPAPAIDPAPPYGAYVPPPPVRSYPSRPGRINGWVARAQLDSVRMHGWDVWESITRPSGEDSLPIWETWFSGDEVYNLEPAEARRRLQAGARRERKRDWELPHQFFHPAARGQKTDLQAMARMGHRIPVDTAEAVTSFNRYTRELAVAVVERGFNRAAVLDSINAAFNARGTPVAQRKISTSVDSVDARQIALKPVFQFISGTQPTVLPYWNGISPVNTDSLENPEPHTWRQGVVIDPTGKLRPGSRVWMSVNGNPPDSLLVVPLSAIYHLRLTAADSAAFSDFAKTSGDDVGAGNLTDSLSVAAMVRPGNYALLTAMHVTTKEIANWTWQTFWWSPHPRDPFYGADRPRTIRGPWSNYNMDVACWMAQPNRKGGDPWIAFNPYLETNLDGTVTVNGTAIQWTGVHSNCMSCHRMAGWQSGGNTPPYVPSGFISPADSSFFAGFTKLDFLWSITRAQ
jgi:hypothetical protein